MLLSGCTERKAHILQGSGPEDGWMDGGCFPAWLPPHEPVSPDQGQCEVSISEIQEVQVHGGYILFSTTRAIGWLVCVTHSRAHLKTP